MRIRTVRNSPCIQSFVTLGVTLVASGALFTGCARVGHPSLSNTSSVERPWGPIAGTTKFESSSAVRAAARRTGGDVVIINHESMAKDAQLALSTGMPLQGAFHSESAPQAAPVSRQIAPPKALKPGPVRSGVESENPFHHPQPLNPLPEEMPKIGEVLGQPLSDRFHEPSSVSTASTGATQSAQTQASSGAASAPQANRAEVPLPQRSVTVPPRGRLAVPQGMNNPQAPVVQEPAASPGSLASPFSTVSAAGSYKFSFSQEIWLLIIILGGVFATLWFRLEYDFGTRKGRRR